MNNGFGNSISKNLSAGGTISGDLTINGDLTVTGSGGAVYDEIIEGSLQIKTGSAGTISDLAYADDLVIENSGAVGISLRSPDGNSGSIVWQSDTSDNIARIYGAYNGGDEILAFETVGTDRMIIDDGGHSTFKGNIIIDEEGGTSNSAVLEMKADRGSDGNLSSEIRFFNDDANYYAAILGHRGDDDSRGDLVLRTRGSGGTNDVRIDQDGTATFSGQVHLGGADQLRIYSEGSGGSDNQIILGKLNDLKIFNQHHDGNISFHVENSSGTAIQAMTVAGSGNVGIGAAVPDATLEIEGSGAIIHLDSADNAVIDIDRAATNRNAALTFSTNDAVNWSVGVGDSDVLGDGTDFFIGGGLASADGTNAKLVIDTSGKVGIGTGTPGFGQDAGEAITNASTLLEVAGTGGNADGATIVLRNTATAIDASTDSELGMIKFAGNDTDVSLNEDGVSSMIRCLVTDTWNATTNDRPSQLEFWTTADGSSAMAQNMTINKNGYVGIGTADPSYNLSVKGASDQVVEINSTSAGDPMLKMVTSGSRTNNISFNDAAGTAGFIKYQHTGDKLEFLAGSTTVVNMVIDANSRISLSNNDAGTSNTVFGYQAGASLISGSDNNTFIGHQVGDAILTTAADYNTGVGATSLTTLTSGYSNSAFGFGSLASLAGGHQNTAIGVNALTNNISANDNVAVGNQSGQYTTGADNTYVGEKAGMGAAGAEASNVGVGSSALAAIVSGEQNVAIGRNAAVAQTTAHDMIFIGTNSGATVSVTTGSHANRGQIGIGTSALNALTTGANNLAIGYQSLDACNTGTSNIAVGSGTLGALTDAVANVAMGLGALGTNVSGNYNTAFGHQALQTFNADVDANNVAVGINALQASDTGTNNTVVGAFAGDAVTSQIDLVLVGKDAGGAINHDDANGTVAIGKSALAALTSGQYNTAIGHNSMDEHLTGRANTCLGWGTMSQSGGDTTAQDNTFIGASSGGGDWAGAGVDQNTAVGYSTMTGAMNGANNNTALGAHGLEALTTGDGNVAVGAMAGDNVTDGDYNTLIGYQSGTEGQNLSTGNNNTLIGAYSDTNATNGVNQTAIGYDATGQQNNSVTLGNAAVTDVFMASDSGALVHTTGIAFPASQVASGGANCLDDYEEGEDVVVLASASGTVGLDADFNHIGYTKVGRAVHIQGHLYNTTFSSGDGVLTITGLPFTSVGDLNDKADTATFLIRVKDGDSADGFYLGIMLTNTTVITVDGYDAENLNTSTSLHISGTYMTA